MTDTVTTYPDLARPDAFTQQGLGWVPWLLPVAEDELTDVQRDALIEPARAKMPYFRLLARDPEALRARTLTDLDIFYNVSGGIGRADARTFALLAHVAAAHRQAGDMQSEPARRDEGLGALIDEAALDQRIGDELLQVLAGLALHARRDFLGEEFEQKIGHQMAPPPAVFSQAAPQALASSRTRRM